MQEEIMIMQKETRELSKQYMTLLATLPVVSDTPFTELYKMDDRSISTVNKGSKNTFAGEAIFAAAISNLVDFFGDPWTDSQIAGTSEIMYSECHWFCFPELKHFTRRVKSMKFGKIFGKFTPAVLMDWACEYNMQAWQERESYFRSKANKINWCEPESPVPDEQITTLFRSFTETLMAEQEALQKKDELKRRKAIDDYNNLLKRQIAHKLKNKN